MSDETKSEGKSPVYRLSKEQAQKLRLISENTGLPQAQLVRTAIDALAKVWEAGGQRLTLPLELDVRPIVSQLTDDAGKYKMKRKKG